MPIEYSIPNARAVVSDTDIDEQIRIEQEQRNLRESRPSIYSPQVSRHARDQWQRYYWLNQERVRHYRVRDQEIVESDRVGRNIHVLLFVKKLNTLSRRRFQLNTWGVRGMRGLSVSHGGAPMKYLCACQDATMPEWDKVVSDQHGMVKRVTRRGWRTVLMMLVDFKAITEPEARQLFGWAWGLHGQVWRRNMWEARNHKLYDAEENKEYWRLKERENFESDQVL